jgi:hypothetical protein
MFTLPDIHCVRLTTTIPRWLACQHLNKLAILRGIADAIGAQDQRFTGWRRKLRTTSAEMPG